MIEIVEIVTALIVGFVGGVLFGRRNKKKVEVAYAELKERFNNLKR